MRRADGFSLLELVVAMALTVVVISALVMAANPARMIADSQPEAMDMQQGARLGVLSMQRDLRLAGAGTDSGVARGPLNAHLPPVLPRRIGARNADPASTARPDVFTLLWIPATVAQATLAEALTTLTLKVKADGVCAFVQPSCGFQQGMGVLVFDDTGRFDMFTAERADADGVVLRHRGPQPVYPYPAGSVAGEVAARTYYFDRAARQIRQYDTDATDTPLLDDVVSMTVEYFGTTRPPMSPKPRIGTANCLFDTAGQRLPVVSGGGSADVPLPLDLFRDGPWCGTGGIEFDADLLRVRRIRVTFAVQASSAHWRASGGGFAQTGSSRTVWNRLPDLSVAFDVSPRNLALRDKEAP